MTRSEFPDSNHPAPAAAASGAEAFEQVFHAYANRLTRYVMRYVKTWDAAQDVVHDVFLQYWLRQQKPAPLPIQDAAAYLYTLARNRALDWCKHHGVESRHRQQELAGSPAGSEPSVAADAEDGLLAREAAALVQRAIDDLPERQRAVLLLRCDQQASYLEIAAALGIAVKTVDAHLQRAIANLRKILLQTLG